jgi:hypothetical protein
MSKLWGECSHSLSPKFLTDWTSHLYVDLRIGCSFRFLEKMGQHGEELVSCSRLNLLKSSLVFLANSYLGGPGINATDRHQSLCAGSDSLFLARKIVNVRYEYPPRVRMRLLFVDQRTVKNGSRINSSLIWAPRKPSVLVLFLNWKVSQ